MKQKIVFIVILVACHLGISQAQMMIPTTTTIRTPYGNVSSTSWRYQPMPNSYNYKQRLIFKRADLVIISKNDSVIKVKAKFDAESKQNTISIKGKKHNSDFKFLPDDTKQVSRFFQNGAPIMKGMPADSCWLFKVISGRINAYSNVPLHLESYVIAIQEGDGPIIKLTKANLEPMINTPDEKIQKLLKKERLIDAIKLFNKTSLN